MQAQDARLPTEIFPAAVSVAGQRGGRGLLSVTRAAIIRPSIARCGCLSGPHPRSTRFQPPLRARFWPGHRRSCDPCDTQSCSDQARPTRAAENAGRRASCITRGWGGWLDLPRGGQGQIAGFTARDFIGWLQRREQRRRDRYALLQPATPLRRKTPFFV